LARIRSGSLKIKLHAYVKELCPWRDAPSMACKMACSCLDSAGGPCTCPCLCAWCTVFKRAAPTLCTALAGALASPIATAVATLWASSASAGWLLAFWAKAAQLRAGVRERAIFCLLTFGWQDLGLVKGKGYLNLIYYHSS